MVRSRMELGPRKAKEFSTQPTRGPPTRQNRLGMVKPCRARDELTGFTLGLAAQIAAKAMFGLG